MEIRKQLLFATKHPYDMTEVDMMTYAICTLLIKSGYKYDDDYAASIRRYMRDHVGVKIKYWKK